MNALYASPRVVTDPGDCFWFHAMDLPEIGTVKGAQDLCETIYEYLGHYDFSGKRCLDIGAASGYLTFEMEWRGAVDHPDNAWWSMSEACVERMLAILGFKLVSKSRAEHACPFRSDREFCTATIPSKARRS